MMRKTKNRKLVDPKNVVFKSKLFHFEKIYIKFSTCKAEKNYAKDMDVTQPRCLSGSPKKVKYS